MKLHELPGDPGRQQKRKRVGRGEGSGHGRQSGKGNKGHQARSGGPRRTVHEGGQMPLIRRIPKRGFNNLFRKEFTPVNLAVLDKSFEGGAVVDHDSLVKAGIIKASELKVKVLGTGSLTKALTVRVQAYSASAKDKITAAGGTVEVI